MGKIYQMANLPVYPIGETDDATRQSFIQMVMDLLSHIDSYDKQEEVAQVIDDWLLNDCTILISDDVEIQFSSALNVAKQMFTKGESDDLSNLFTRSGLKLDQRIVRNDYLPIDMLVTRLRRIL